MHVNISQLEKKNQRKKKQKNETKTGCDKNCEQERKMYLVEKGKRKKKTMGKLQTKEGERK